MENIKELQERICDSEGFVHIGHEELELLRKRYQYGWITAAVARDRSQFLLEAMRDAAQHAAHIKYELDMLERCPERVYQLWNGEESYPKEYIIMDLTRRMPIRIYYDLLGEQLERVFGTDAGSDK